MTLGQASSDGPLVSLVLAANWSYKVMRPTAGHFGRMKNGIISDPLGLERQLSLLSNPVLDNAQTRFGRRGEGTHLPMLPYCLSEPRNRMQMIPRLAVIPDLVLARVRRRSEVILIQ